ncbi:MAG: recombinase family protein [Candidatus Dormibacteria bacterium]
MRIGYGRVSTTDQNLDAQRDALQAADCDEVLVDKASGKLVRRPELDKALLVAREGDQLVAPSSTGGGRSLEHLIVLSRDLQARGVDLVVIDQGIDTPTAVGQMFFQTLGAIAEFEHASMAERTRDGLAAARARGRTGGQRPKLSPRQGRITQEMYEAIGPDGRRGHTFVEVAAEFGVSSPASAGHLDDGLALHQATGEWRGRGRVNAALPGAPTTARILDGGDHQLGPIGIDSVVEALRRDGPIQSGITRGQAAQRIPHLDHPLRGSEDRLSLGRGALRQCRQLLEGLGPPDQLH